jgi:putative flippase GtrA
MSARFQTGSDMHAAKVGRKAIVWNSQFVRYLLVGGWNTVFGMAVYAGLYGWLGGRVHYLALLVPANILAVTNAYVCYKLFVFKTRGNILREYGRCYVVYGGIMLAAAVLMYVLVDGLGMPPTVANCLSVVLTTVVSYLAHRGFSFKAQA